MKWEDLNTQNKAELIKLYVRNGVTSLDKMKEHYNSFGDGGSFDKRKPRFPLQTYLDTLMYQEGGDKIYTATGKTVTIKARKPDWQRGLTDYDWARARKYYPDGNGMVSDRGIGWLKHISKKRGGRNSGNEYLYSALRNVRDFYENDVIPRAQRYKQSYESQDNLNKKINNLKTVVSNLQPSNYIYKDVGQASGMFNPLTGYIYLKNKPDPELYFGPYGYTIQQGPLISHEDTHLEQSLSYPNYLNEREKYLLEKAYPYTEGVSKTYGPLAPIMKNMERQATNRQLRHELFNEDKLFIDDPFDTDSFDEKIKNGRFDYMIEDFIKNNNYFGRGKNYKPTKKDLDNVKEALLEVANNQNDLSNSYSNIMKYGGHLFADGGFLSKIKSLFAPSYKGTFNQAYSQAVKNGDEYFKWNGNRYNTKDSGEKRKPSSTVPDYSKYTFNQAYKKANKELPVNGEFGWRGNAYSANNSKEANDLEKMPAYKLWETVTGQPWSKAKEWGFTDGSAKTNIGLRKALLRVKDTANKEHFKDARAAIGSLVFNNKSNIIPYYFNVPTDEKPITIEDYKAGKNQGTVLFPTVMDSLATHGFKTKTSPVITFGLPAQESAMSPLYGVQTSDVNNYNKMDAAWYMFSAWDAKNSPLDDLYKNLNHKDDNTLRESIKRGAPYAFRQYADYTIPSNIIDWSYNKFKSGTYNKGRADHTPAVLKRGKDFMKAKEVQDWFYNHWLPGQNNQQEWLNWWNSGANYASGGSLFRYNN